MSTIRDDGILSLLDKPYSERDIQDIERALQAPTPPELIEWRPQDIQKYQGQLTALAVSYVDARFMQNRLDEVCGIFNWQSRVKCEAGLLILGISIRHPKANDEWIIKWDTGQDTAQELLDNTGFGGARGIFSTSFKRACYQWGLARDLYALPKPRCRCKAYKNKRDKWAFTGWIDHPDSRMTESEETGRGHISKVDEPTDHMPATSTTYFAIAYNKIKLDRDQAKEIIRPFIDKESGEINYARAIMTLEMNLPPDDRLFTKQEKKRGEKADSQGEPTL